MPGIRRDHLGIWRRCGDYRMIGLNVQAVLKRVENVHFPGK